MTLTTDPIECTGCCRTTTVGQLCPHRPPMCGFCCGKECWKDDEA